MSKPIAAGLRREASAHPKFRGFIIGIAQANHRFTANVHRRVYGHLTDIHIHPLNEEKAIQAAADLLGELFVFSAAGAAIIYEVQRSARSEARKEEVRSQEIDEIKKNGEQIKKNGEQLSLEVHLLKKKVWDLEVQIMKQKISEAQRREVQRQFWKWTGPGFGSFNSTQAAAQPAGTQQPTAA